jgi:signal transduction histidine kinase
VFTRLRWTAFGLRGRIVSAVLVSTLLTLGVAAAVLLPRLEASLRNAARATLQSDLRHDQRDIAQIGRIDYQLIPELRVRSLIGTRQFAQARRAARALQDALAELQQDLGGSSVYLIGFVDSSGHGEPVLAPFASEAAAAAAADDSFNDVTAAYLGNGKPDYSFGVESHTEVVRAAIPLRSDDAVLAVRKSIDDISNSVGAVRRAFEIAALAGLLLTALLAVPLAGTLVRRLRLLRASALRVAEEGIGAEVPIDRARDEVGDLARSFGIMSRRLGQQEEARRAFVATASHELRTPLASLEGMLELLAEDLDDASPDITDAKELLERARVQSRRLGRLAADLLDLSRIDADIKLRSEPVELAEIARAVIAEFELALREREVVAALHDPPTPVWAVGDPGSVARIVRILIDNALRVAPEGSALVIELDAEPSPTLRVKDSGPGVVPEERALIFQRFQRGRDTGGEAGFGLGLAIGRELAARMGGSLELAEADAPGATFVLRLQAVPASEQLPRRRPLAARQQ